MSSHFIPPTPRLNATTFIEAVDTMIKLWIERGSDALQQYSALSFKRIFITSPPRCLDFYPYTWGVVEREANHQLHNTNGLLKAVIMGVMAKFDEKRLIRAYSCFRGRIEAVLEVRYCFIELPFFPLFICSYRTKHAIVLFKDSQ